ncbi:MAG TPA: PASTA domain-containing protein [Baekduia sp.]
MIPAALCLAGLAGGPANAQQAPEATAAAVKRVPNEVGQNHQAAQDDLQAHGFYRLREKDCSGKGRLLLWDRNWKVVRQSPKAGSRVSTNRTITLCSVKYTD